MSYSAIQRYRKRQKQRGLRMLQIWVPDTRIPGFAEEAERQSIVACSNTDLENSIMDWVEHASDTEGWEW